MKYWDLDVTLHIRLLIKIYIYEQWNKNDSH